MEFSQLQINFHSFINKFDHFSKTVLQEIDEIKVKLDRLEKVQLNNIDGADHNIKNVEPNIICQDKCNEGKSEGVILYQNLENAGFRTLETELINNDNQQLVSKSKNVSSQTVVKEEDYKTELSEQGEDNSRATNENSDTQVSQIFKMNQDIANRLKKLVEDKFNSFAIKDLHPTHLKVVAGIVMTRNSNHEIISVTMGTKCIFGKYLSWNGKSLNDMHAEVTARRCFVHYVYDQLSLIAFGNEQSSIFTLREDKKGYKLKDGIQFHLYINIPPCGDATSSNNVGCLKTKVESTEGTFPISADQCVQSQEKILNGQKLKTMSCSDKICKWNVLGVQGALLSHFIEPIYLNSVIIGRQMNPNKLQRAICGRIAKCIRNDLPLPYHINRPAIFLSSSKKNRCMTEAPNFCVNWCIRRSEPEVIVTKTGLPKNQCGVSRYCKWEFMYKFMNLKSRISTITDIDKAEFTYYSEIKAAAVSYNETKEILYKAFKTTGLGTWMSKPKEQDIFKK